VAYAEVASGVVAFNEATNRHDIDAMLALVSDDFVFESTTPPTERELLGSCGSLRVLSEDPDRRGLADDRDAAILTHDQLFSFDPPSPGSRHVRSVGVLRVTRGKIVPRAHERMDAPSDASSR
jgi:SnoaL-like domain